VLVIDLFNSLSRYDSLTSTLFELVDTQLFPVILNLMSMLFFISFHRPACSSADGNSHVCSDHNLKFLCICGPSWSAW